MPEQDSTFCATSSHTHSAPKPTELNFPILPMSSLSPLVACTDYFPVLKTIKTYSTFSIMATTTLSSSQPTTPLGCVNKYACGEEFRNISLQSSSPNRKTRHSVLKKSLIWTGLLNCNQERRNCIT
jgi:hypothetical protein